MPLIQSGDPEWFLTWARPSKLFAADGITLKQLVHGTGTQQNTPQDGDRLQSFFVCRGDETKLSIGCSIFTSSGIFDIYVNDVLDSSGYDNYNGTTSTLQRYITLTLRIVKGKNVIELRVNGKNALSTNYTVNVFGISLQ